MNIQKVKDQSFKLAMEAMNNGSYVTIICYVTVPRGTDFIGGQTFKDTIYQSMWNGKHHVR